MGGMLVLQLRTSLYLRELEYSAASGGAFVRGIGQRFRRNLAILGGHDVSVLQAEAAASGAANDDLARERATTFSAVGSSANSAGFEAAAQTGISGGDDDGAEVALFGDSEAPASSRQLLRGGGLPAAAESPPSRSSSFGIGVASALGSSSGASSSSSGGSGGSGGGSGGSGGGGGGSGGSGGSGGARAWEAAQAPPAAAEAFGGAGQADMLAASDAQALSEALG
jgi:uncharacterized membrane protein YgcG